MFFYLSFVPLIDSTADSDFDTDSSQMAVVLHLVMMTEVHSNVPSSVPLFSGMRTRKPGSETCFRVFETCFQVFKTWFQVFKNLFSGFQKPVFRFSKPVFRFSKPDFEFQTRFSCLKPENRFQNLFTCLKHEKRVWNSKSGFENLKTGFENSKTGFRTWFTSSHTRKKWDGGRYLLFIIYYLFIVYLFMTVCVIRWKNFNEIYLYAYISITAGLCLNC